MPIIKSVQEAEELFREFIPNVAKYLGNNMTLDRMWPLLKSVGNPQDRLKVIHVAGTSGKTSTCYFISSILSAHGVKVGLTVSPHVNSVTERVQINGKPLQDLIFCRYLSEFFELIKDVNPEPSYFEVLVAFAYWVFDKERVDYAVIETGLGGLHDGTNVVSRSDKICVLTDIGYDHMDVLGKTLAEIATQKAGIVQKSNHVFFYEQDTAVMRVYEKEFKKKRAQIHKVEFTGYASYRSYFPTYQKRNWWLAYQVSVFLKKRDKFAKILTQQEVIKTQIHVPGRMEIIEYQERLFVLDGAHNEQKMTAFVDSFQKLYPNQKVPVLLVMKQGKEAKNTVRCLLQIASEFVLCPFATKQDTPIKSMRTKELKDVIVSLDAAVPITEIDTLSKAVQILCSKTNKIAVITGSFYPLADVKKFLISVLDS